ncbi:LytR/AlgR family response regulator transcription factor [Hufsiella ginkgonis]|uniref:Response regulator n=1 Tax=Hufsiella ginkgonis TaxID=2695274 RepID=A0A7K1Y0N1_9SPHI|nr:LytTR family DNA-binding domain-containing protein [Hufsiella ginkgonis]MXV16647.1 response regulator [Hufsiella ginkgonis]
MRAIIIDDEPHCISSLKYDINLFCPEVEVIDACHNGHEGISSIKKNDPDLVFLDIEMPAMNGLQMLDQLGGNIPFQLVFTTAYDKFAAQAFRLSAVDYLLKPIDTHDLMDAVSRVKLRLNRDVSRQFDNLKYNFGRPFAEQRVAFPHRDGYDFVNVKDIAYCRADGAYTTVTMADGKSTLLSKSLGEVTEMLPVKLFERIHHSTLVNIQFITQFIKRDGGYVVMGDGVKLAVSRSKKDRILSLLGLERW